MITPSLIFTAIYTPTWRVVAEVSSVCAIYLLLLSLLLAVVIALISRDVKKSLCYGGGFFVVSWICIMVAAIGVFKLNEHRSSTMLAQVADKKADIDSIQNSGPLFVTFNITSKTGKKILNKDVTVSMRCMVPAKRIPDLQALFTSKGVDLSVK